MYINAGNKNTGIVLNFIKIEKRKKNKIKKVLFLFHLLKSFQKTLGNSRLLK